MTPTLLQSAQAHLSQDPETAPLARVITRARRNPRYGSVLLYRNEEHVLTMVDGRVIWRGEGARKLNHLRVRGT